MCVLTTMAYVSKEEGVPQDAIGSYREIAIATESEAGDSLT